MRAADLLRHHAEPPPPRANTSWPHAALPTKGLYPDFQNAPPAKTKATIGPNRTANLFTVRISVTPSRQITRPNLRA